MAVKAYTHPADDGHVAEDLAKDEDLPWRELDDVLAAARQFLDPVLAANAGTWKAARWRWEQM